MVTKTIQSGRLLQSIEIHAQSLTFNALRERVNTWTKITGGDWRCEITTVRGAEVQSLGGEIGETIYQVKGYYRSDLTKRHRLVWGDKVLDILHIENVDQRNQALVIDAREVSRSGVLAR